MRLYLSGKMTGLPDFNFPKFHEYALILRRRGHQVTNPAENFDGRMDLPRWMYLRLAYEQVPMCDAVAVMPGWGGSMGAWGEIRIARDVNIPILDADSLEPAPLFQEALEVSDAALACIGRIMEGGRKKHPAYTWAQEPEDEHVRKSMRHALSYQLQRDGQSPKDHEDHLQLATCRMVLALARRERTCPNPTNAGLPAGTPTVTCSTP